MARDDESTRRGLLARCRCSAPDGARGDAAGARLRLIADDPAAAVDVPHFCAEAGHLLIDRHDLGAPLHASAHPPGRRGQAHEVDTPGHEKGRHALARRPRYRRADAGRGAPQTTPQKSARV